MPADYEVANLDKEGLDLLKRWEAELSAKLGQPIALVAYCRET